MIIGLTDRPASFPQIGTLRKGAPKPENSNKPGADLKYFRFDCDDGEAAGLFAETYGPEPVAIRVYVPFKTTDENFDAWREEWTASSLKHRCDGQTCVRWLTPQGTYSAEPKPCPGNCKQVGRLQVIIPELKRMAFVTVLTTSIHDILEIHSNLLALESARGDLRGIPLILKRAPREISTPSGSNGQRARREKWLITIEAQPQWVELQLTAQERAALPQAAPLALPEWEGDEEEVEDPDPVMSKTEILDAIARLWPQHGARRGGKLVPFEDYIHQRKGVTDPRQLTLEQAQTILAGLQEASIAAERRKPEPATHVAEVVTEPETVAV